MFPFLNGAPCYEEYQALKTSLACYDLKNDWQVWQSAELPTFGLVADVIHPGVIDGSHRYDHAAVHKPHQNEEPTL